MKLSKIREWIKKKFIKYRRGGIQIQPAQDKNEAKQQEEIKEQIKNDCMIDVNVLAEVLTKTRQQAGHTIGEKKEAPKVQTMSNNCRKMKGFPMVRWQQLKRGALQLKQAKKKGNTMACKRASPKGRNLQRDV